MAQIPWKFATAWLEYIEEVDLTNNPMPYQPLTLKYFETLVHCKIKSKDGSTETEETNAVLMYEEENAIRYMSEYVIQKLRSIY